MPFSVHQQVPQNTEELPGKGDNGFILTPCGRRSAGRNGRIPCPLPGLLPVSGKGWESKGHQLLVNFLTEGRSTGYGGYKKVKGDKLSARIIRTVSTLSARYHSSISMMPGFTSQPLKHSQLLIRRSNQRSSRQMQPTMPGRFVSTIGTGASRAIFLGAKDQGNSEVWETILVRSGTLYEA